MLPRPDSNVRFRGLELNIHNRAVKAESGTYIQLTQTEMEVLLDLLNRKSEVVRREEFTPWSGKNTNRDRHPVDNHISSLQSKLGDGLIVPVSGIGYRLAPGTAVEMRPSATASEAEVLDSVAVEHFKTHRGPEILASIANCENRIKMGQADASTYVVLALAYMNAGHDGFCQMKRGEAFSLAKGAIAHALELNSRLSSAYALRGLAHFAEYAWVNAKDDFEKALALDSKEALAHCFYGHLLACQHEDVKAVEHSSYAAELRPTDRIFVLGEPWVYTLVGRCQEAVQKALRAVSLFPSFPPIHVVLGWAYQAAEHVDDAVAEYEIALKTEFHPAALASLGNAQAVQGRITTANSTLKSLDSSPKEHNLAYVSAYNRALILAGYGSSRKAECLKALEQGFERKSVWLPYAVADPRFSSLWAEKRFIKLVEKMGLTIRQA